MLRYPIPERANMTDDFLTSLLGYNGWFAWNCARWLCNLENRQASPRKYLLFLAEGKPAPVLFPELHVPQDVTLEPPTWEDLANIPLGDLMKLSSEFIVAVEQDNVFNRLLTAKRWRDLSARMLRYGLLILTGLTLVTTLCWMLLGRSRPAALPEPNQSTLLLRRQNAVVQHGHLGAAARILARGFFARCHSAGLQLFQEESWRRVQPMAVAAGGWWTRWRTAAQVRALWRWATADQEPRCDGKGLRRLSARIEALDRCMTAGMMRITWLKS
jgi:hypothetical protein